MFLCFTQNSCIVANYCSIVALENTTADRKDALDYSCLVQLSQTTLDCLHTLNPCVYLSTLLSSLLLGVSPMIMTQTNGAGTCVNCLLPASVRAKNLTQFYSLAKYSAFSNLPRSSLQQDLLLFCMYNRCWVLFFKLWLLMCGSSINCAVQNVLSISVHIAAEGKQSY